MPPQNQPEKNLGPDSLQPVRPEAQPLASQNKAEVLGTPIDPAELQRMREAKVRETLGKSTADQVDVVGSSDKSKDQAGTKAGQAPDEQITTEEPINVIREFEKIEKIADPFAKEKAFEAAQARSLKDKGDVLDEAA